MKIFLKSIFAPEDLVRVCFTKGVDVLGAKIEFL